MEALRPERIDAEVARSTDGDERSVIRCGSTFGHWLGTR
jgi:hypothetical protein